MNTDFSVAPEIARLAAPLVSPWPDAASPRTDGRVAADLTDLAATPEDWWDLVRFDPSGPLRIPVPGGSGTWLLVAPPGSAAYCDCRYATLVAGEAAETATPLGPGGPGHSDLEHAGRPLLPGRVRVHGTRAGHRLSTVGHGYSVTLHQAAATGHFS